MRKANCEEPLGDEPPPSRSQSRPSIWQGMGEAEWNDWRWQLRHCLTTIDELRQVLKLSPEEEQGILARNRMRFAITPHFASLMDPNDPMCPIRRQVVPTIQELESSDQDFIDPLREEAQSPVPGLVHRYPDRVLLLVTDRCASYCRHCTRRRLVGEKLETMSRERLAEALGYITRTPVVRDVLVSGGDPLILPDDVIEYILRELRRIPHVEIVRIGTRVPVYLPQRITPKLVRMLRRYHPLWINIHFNHPKEIVPETRRACEMLADGGIPLGSQTVLLAGINDCPNVMKKLMQELLKIRVRPYYIYQCDLVKGTAHFRTPVSVGLEIMEALRGHTSGLAVPTLIIDAPGGGGKVPIMPQYFISQSSERVVVRNYQGLISAYNQPTDYKGHRAEECPYCIAARERNEGVAQLLQSEAVTLAHPIPGQGAWRLGSLAEREVAYGPDRGSPL